MNSIDESMEEPLEGLENKLFKEKRDCFLEGAKQFGIEFAKSIPFYRLVESIVVEEKKYSFESFVLDTTGLLLIGTLVSEGVGASKIPELQELSNIPIAQMTEYQLSYSSEILGILVRSLFLPVVMISHAHTQFRNTYEPFKKYIEKIESKVNQKTEDISVSEHIVRFLDHTISNTKAVAVGVGAIIANNIYRMFDMNYFDIFREWESDHLYGPTMIQHVALIYAASNVAKKSARLVMEQNGSYVPQVDGVDLKKEIGLSLFGFVAGMTSAILWEVVEKKDPRYTTVPMDTIADYIWGGAGGLFASFEGSEILSRLKQDYTIIKNEMNGSSVKDKLKYITRDSN